MAIGSTAESRAEGARLILAGIKTATSSAFWDYPDGPIPFVGALSLLLGGDSRPVGIVETTRVEKRPFFAIDAEFAFLYGEGDRTLAWWRREIGEWYRAEALRRGENFTADTPLICEWFRVIRRF